MAVVDIGRYRCHDLSVTQRAWVQDVVDHLTFDMDLLDGPLHIYFRNPGTVIVNGDRKQSWGQAFKSSRSFWVWPGLSAVNAKYTIAHETGHHVCYDLLGSSERTELKNEYLRPLNITLGWKEGPYTNMAHECFAHQFAVRLYADSSAVWKEVNGGNEATYPNENGLYRRFFHDDDLSTVRNIVETGSGGGGDDDDPPESFPGFDNFAVTRDTARRQKVNGTTKQGAGKEEHLPIGYIGGEEIDDYKYTALVYGEITWLEDIESIDSAYLELTVTADPATHISASGAKSVLMASRVTEAWTEGTKTEGEWHADDWRNPTWATALRELGPVGYHVAGTRRQFDIMAFMAEWAPARIRVVGHGAGQNKANHGLFLRAAVQDKLNHTTEFASSEADDEDDRPNIYITYTAKSQPPVGWVVEPVGEVNTTIFDFVGEYADPMGRDEMGSFEMEVRRNGGSNVWTPAVEQANANSSATGRFIKSSTEAPAGTWQAGQDYEWRHRVRSKDSEKWSEWTAWTDFSVTSEAPVITATSLGTRATLDSVFFGGPYTDSEGETVSEMVGPLGFPRMAMWHHYWAGRDLESTQSDIALMVSMNQTGVILTGLQWDNSNGLPDDVEDHLDLYIAAGITPYIALFMGNFNTEETTRGLARWADGNGKWAGAIFDLEDGWKNTYQATPGQAVTRMSDFCDDLRAAGCDLIGLCSYSVPEFGAGVNMGWDELNSAVDLHLPQVYLTGGANDNNADVDRLLSRSLDAFEDEGQDWDVPSKPVIPVVNAYGLNANADVRRYYIKTCLGLVNNPEVDPIGSVVVWRFPIQNSEVRDMLGAIPSTPGTSTVYRILNTRLQLRSEAQGDPAWAGDTGFLWDTGESPITDPEKTSSTVKRLYAGQALTPGAYTYRVQVQNALGAWSAWSYATFTLTVGYDPDPGAGDNLSGYGRQKLGTRIVIRDMNAERGPGEVKAIIYDASNIGASIVANDIGEFYFTIPTTHPQASEIEPLQRHYALEFYRAGSWRPVYQGLIRDMDATEDDVVFYGLDYMGLLSKSIETAFFDQEHPEEDISSGGAKYIDKQISFIIKDQLERGRDATDSPMEFINVEPKAQSTLMEGISEKINIHAEFRERLGFILGLIQSAKQGTGKRSRLWVERTATDNYRWRYRTNAGTERDNLRLRYGELVQGFRLVLLGDWASNVYGVGRITNQILPRFHSASAPGIDTNIWGNLQMGVVWQDLIDENDLKRRVKQMAMEMGKFGKSVALGLRVHGLAPLDGYDLMDQVPVEIIRGAVDTTRYGSGYWTILGCEYRLFPDGHDELTLAIKPREDETPPSEDLIPSNHISMAEEWSRAGIVGTNLAANTTARIRNDGTSSPLLEVTWDAIVEDNFGTWAVQVARNGTGDFTGAPVYMTEDNSIEIEDLAPAQTYSIRVGAFDTSGHFSGYSTHITATAAPDTEAPLTPGSLSLLPAIRALLVGWLPVTALDLSQYEVQWRHVGEVTFETLLTKTTALALTGLDAVPHEVKVRAIDLTGNASAFTVLVIETPLLVQGSDIDNEAIDTAQLADGAVLETKIGPLSINTGMLQANIVRAGHILAHELTTDHITTAGLDAAIMKTGTMSVGGDGHMPLFIVYDSEGREIVRLDEGGAVFTDATNPDRIMRWVNGTLEFTDDGGLTWDTAINADGVTASAIRVGVAPGGHNLLPNSSFESLPFVTSLAEEWTSTADWNDDFGTPVNMVVGTDELKISDVIY